MSKLNHYGVRGLPLNWLRSYLHNRSQYVCYNNNSSSLLPISCGVPQGSILGPLLFIIYINDLCNVSNILKFFLFADDTNIFYSCNDIKEAERILNENITLLSRWFRINKLSLNLSKTKFMVFMGKLRSNVETIELKVDHIVIERVTETNFLGVVIDDKLSWQSHIRQIERKIAKNIGIIFRVRDLLESNKLYILYCSLILPYLFYCCTVWGINYKVKLNNLIKLQKKAIRLIDGAMYRDHTSEIFCKYKTLKLEDIVEFSISVIMFKVSKGTAPPTILSMFSNNCTVHNYNTRQRENVHMNFARTNMRLHTFSIKGAQVWNKLPINVKYLPSVFCFKRNVKNLLLSRY